MGRWRRLRVALALITVILLAMAGTYLFAGEDRWRDSNPVSGIQLVRPLFAQSNTASFPDPEAGISAYIQLAPSNMDFAKLTPLFTVMVDAGDNHIIGTIPLARLIWTGTTQSPVSNNSADVRVYADTDGFAVAYLTQDIPNAEIFRWSSWDPASQQVSTVLEDALDMVAVALGEPFDPSIVSWYHWAHPTATQLAAAAKAGAGNVFLEIPSGATIDGLPSYFFHTRGNSSGFPCSSGALGVTGTDGSGGPLVSSSNSDKAVIADLGLLSGVAYTFTVAQGTCNEALNRLGLAVVYTP